MGVAGLWDVLRPAAQSRSLAHIALQDGFTRPPPLRGFRIGIDASIWFFHAAYGKEGENPELRTLFFRCARLMHTPFLPLFVFDGPKRPDVKRGKRIGKEAHWMTGGMKNIIEAFGFEWRTAPGEAEAELAYLNRVGVIDGILSDDVDNFLFGATLVIRNPSPTLTGNSGRPLPTPNHTTVFSFPHPEVNLTRGGLILIALLSGGDYHKGLDGCGMKVAVGLARCGFGDSLLEAVWKFVKGAGEEEGREELEEWLVGWRGDVAKELATNSQGHLPSKRTALSKALLSFNSPPPTGSKSQVFPDIRILLYYTTPLTSETYHRSSRNKIEIDWTKGEPDLGKIAGVCELYFEWGWKAMIVKRFRTVIWNGAVCRILRRAIVQADKLALAAGPGSDPATPTKNIRKDAECGTPSKMIAKHFADSPSKRPLPASHYDHSRAFSVSSDHSSDNGDNASSDDGNKQSEPLITKIHSSRTHASTDHLLEYRLEIAPAQLVRLVEGGIKGTRVQPEIDDIYADHEHDGEDGFDGDSDDEGGKKGKKGAKKPPPDPDSHLRVWMPACMVRLVEPGLVEEYEETLRRRKEMKAGKGKGRKANKQPTKVVAWFDEPSDKDIAAKKSTTKSKPIAAAAASKKSRAKTKGYVDVSDEDSMDSDNVRNNLKAYLTVTKPNAPLKTGRLIAERALASEPSGSQSKSQPKAKSKPPPIPHIPLYDSDSGSSSEAATLGAPARPKTKSKSSPAIMRILSPASSAAPAHKSTKAAEPSPMRMEPRPFPMPVDDYDYVDNDFDFNFALWNANGDEDVGLSANMNEDPFLDVDRHPEPPISPTPSPPKQGRKKLSQPSSDTGTESYGTRIKKSPRKSKDHTSPKHSPVRSDRDSEPGDSEFEGAARPGSPSPVRPRPKAPVLSTTSKRMPKIVKKYVAPPKVDDTLIEISSGDDTPPPAKAMRPPLLISKSRNYVKGAKSVIKIQTKSVLATSDINSLPTYDNDIIDLT